MVLAAASFALLMLLPTNFGYVGLAFVLFVNGIGNGLFAALNTTSIMNWVPAAQRGAASGVRATFMSTGFVLSIGIFFSLMIVGLASRLPAAMHAGLVAQGVPAADASRVAGLPPVGSLFAAFLGFNPMQTLFGHHVLGALPASKAAHITGKSFFPSLISTPFHFGLMIAFSTSALMCSVAAVASWRAGSGRDQTRRRPEPAIDEPVAAETEAWVGA
jgi:MFS family permease